jgi:hypothetical protein
VLYCFCNCAVFCLNVLCYFVCCVLFCVLCVILCVTVVPVPLGVNPFAFKISNNNNNNNNNNSPFVTKTREYLKKPLQK